MAPSSNKARARRCGLYPHPYPHPDDTRRYQSTRSYHSRVVIRIPGVQWVHRTGGNAGTVGAKSRGLTPLNSRPRGIGCP
jgi:hypothetical protein